MEGTYEEHWISYVALVGRDLPANVEGVRDVGSTPVWGRYPGRGHGNPLQDSCQENPMDRGAWWTTVFAIAKSWTRLKRYSTDARLKGVDSQLGKLWEDGRGWDSFGINYKPLSAAFRAESHLTCFFFLLTCTCDESCFPGQTDFFQVKQIVHYPVHFIIMHHIGLRKCIHTFWCIWKIATDFH